MLKSWFLPLLTVWLFAGAQGVGLHTHWHQHGTGPVHSHVVSNHGEAGHETVQARDLVEVDEDRASLRQPPPLPLALPAPEAPPLSLATAASRAPMALPEPPRLTGPPPRSRPPGQAPPPSSDFA